jgi:hypothetical protein
MIRLVGVIFGDPKNVILLGNPNNTGDIGTHGFEYYLGYPIEDKNGTMVQTDIALNLLQKYLEERIDPFYKPSQYNPQTEGNIVSFSNLSNTIDNVYVFNKNGKIYKIKDQYVKASPGGTKILDTWENQKANELFKLEGTDEIIFEEPADLVVNLTIFNKNPNQDIDFSLVANSTGTKTLKSSSSKTINFSNLENGQNSLTISTNGKLLALELFDFNGTQVVLDIEVDQLYFKQIAAFTNIPGSSWEITNLDKNSSSPFLVHFNQTQVETEKNSDDFTNENKWRLDNGDLLISTEVYDTEIYYTSHRISGYIENCFKVETLQSTSNYHKTYKMCRQ